MSCQKGIHKGLLSSPNMQAGSPAQPAQTPANPSTSPGREKKEERRSTQIFTDERRCAFATHTACKVHQWLAGEWDQRRASSDSLRMRFFLRATKVAPRPEPVEGRKAALQRCADPAAAVL